MKVMLRKFVSVTIYFEPMSLLVFMSGKEIMEQKLDVASKTAFPVCYDFVNPYSDLYKNFKTVRGYVINSHLSL
jgi:hypothetical protein